MDPDVVDAAFRDEVLLVSTSLTVTDLSTLSESGRHRCALRLLRSWGLWRPWRALYGSELDLLGRLRRVLATGLRRQAHPRNATELVASIVEGPAAATVARIHQQGEVLTRRLQAPLDRIANTVARLFAPFQRLGQRIGDALRPLTDGLSRKLDQVVRLPALRGAAQFLQGRQFSGLDVQRPIDILLRTQEQRLRSLFVRPEIGRQGEVVEGTTSEKADEPAVESLVEVPDAETLAIFFAQERGDPNWHRGPFGWLLSHIPLSIGGSLHGRIADSSEEALAWMAERFLRHEIRRTLHEAVAALPCRDDIRERLVDGIDAYTKSRFSTADTLLTTGLEGVLFDLAVANEVLTEGHRVIRTGKKPGNKVSTASDSRVLSGLGFDLSQQAYLSGLPLGKKGHPARHGQDPEMGAYNHGAAAILGLILVMTHIGGDSGLPARALLNP